MFEHEDHRDLAKRLDLFHFEEVAPGMVFWHPRGWAVYRRLEEIVRRRAQRELFEEVRTPQLLRRAVWEESGHWQHFKEGMFAFLDGAEDAAVKPVSCPGHAHLVRRRAPGHRALPIRIFELGLVHRDEPSGALQGLLRLRQFTQDDGHVFCRPEQAEAELLRFLGGVAPFYQAFGFEKIRFALSLRPESRAGDELAWDWAEGVLSKVLDGLGHGFSVQPGAGAFYGPKVEVVLSDRLGREWQCGTIQLDVVPERFGLEYVDADGSRKPPVMLHQALFGSLERFIAMVLEQHGARLPAWLSPEPVVLLPIGADAAAQAQRWAEELREEGVAAAVDAREESLSRRIAEAHERGVPEVWVVGPAELASSSVSRRRAGASVVQPFVDLVPELVQSCRPPKVVYG